MASGFFALLDDISVLMDDVLTMSKVSAKKTVGLLGDDLAVNAEKASGFAASRELPVLWAITKGSFLNKLVILPLAFLLSAFLPWAVSLVLIIGGLYLAFEGAEKVFDFLFPHKITAEKNSPTAVLEEERLILETKKIKSAILTDFILSVEIVIIALGSVVDQPTEIKIGVVTLISIVATVGVYGIVALIVRMDDLGFKLVQLSKGHKNSFYYMGMGLVKALPLVIKMLSIVGTIALLLVSGGIFVHNVALFHSVLEGLPGTLRDLVIGSGVGLTVLLVVKFVKWVYKRSPKNS